MAGSVIFDFDGTVADTLPLLLKIYNEKADSFDLPKITPHQAESLRNLSTKENIRNFGIKPWQLIRVLRIVRKELKKNIGRLIIVEGMDKVLLGLCKQSVLVGIVTSNSKENVQLFLDKNNIKCVSFIHSERGLFGKGKILKRVMRTYGLAKGDTIYIGDEVRDIEAANEAGIACIAVSWGFNSKKRLREAEPDLVVSTPRQLLNTLYDLPLTASKPNKL